MELTGASYEQTYINISGAAASNTSTVGRLPSQDASSLIQKPSLHTKYQSDTEHVCDLSCGTGFNEQCRTRRKPRQGNSACSSLGGNGSRSSSRRPVCRCRSGKNLGCPLSISNDTLQHASCKSRALVTVQTDRKASTAKTIPKSACTRCQKRKGKCTGERPVCRYCSDRGLDCSWDVSTLR